MSLTDIELPSEYLRRCTLAWVMANTFRRRDVDQSWVLPTWNVFEGLRAGF
jgi:hypothetical protein